MTLSLVVGGLFGPAAAANEPGPGAGPAAGATPPVTRRAWLMGTTCTISGLAPDRPTGLAAIDAAFAAIAAAEAELSTWRPDSDLSRLNAAPVGEDLALPPGLLDLLERLRGLAVQSGGAFDPAVMSLVAAWDVRGPGRTPTPAEIDAARAAAGMHLVELDRTAGVARRLAAVGIDAGAFGKGEGLARAAAVLSASQVRHWLVDFGGQVLASADGPRHRVALADPGPRREPVAWLHLRGVSAATSGASERPGHILDPRSGRPAPDFGSVTVVHPDPVVADALSTALYVMGPDAGLEWAEERGIAALFALHGRRRPALRHTSEMQAWLVPPPHPVPHGGGRLRPDTDAQAKGQHP